MTALTATGLALARAAAVGALAAVAAPPLRGILPSPAAGRAGSRALWGAFLLPLVWPSLVAGYAYSDFALSLVRRPVLGECLYVALVFLKLLPAAALVLRFAPPPLLTPESVHCHRLARPRIDARASQWRFAAGGRLGATAAASLVVFLLAFVEFELAARMGIPTWTVLLFDAQAGGLALADSLRMAVAPAACQSVGLALVLAVLLRIAADPGGDAAGGRIHRAATRRMASVLAGWGLLGLSLMAVVVVPAALVVREAFAGFEVLIESFAIARELGASLLFGAGAATCAALVAGWLASATGRLGAAKRLAILTAAAFPGFLGSLLVGLCVLALFQTGPLGVLYDTPVPLLAALTLTGMPTAIVLGLVLEGGRDAAALHLAGMQEEQASSARVRRAGRSIAGTIRREGRSWVLFLLFCLAYFDVLSSSLLAPSGMTPVFVRLHNLMHYGRTATLSSMVLVTVALPLVLAGAAAAAGSIASRRVFSRGS